MMEYRKDRSREVQDHWGPWEFRENLTLAHVGMNYEIDLEEIDSSASMLDWIFQITGKSWVDHEAMGYFIEAMEHILGPQSNYCSLGEEHGAPGTGSELAANYKNKLKRQRLRRQTPNDE